MKRWAAFLLVAMFVGLVLFAENDLPDRAALDAPANEHVSPYYIQNAYRDTHTPNMVTAVLADYRGYDTLGETVVILAAGLACLLILRKDRPESGEKDGGMGEGNSEDATKT